MEESSMDRNVSIITDLDGGKIVVVHDICFKGKRKINWNNVEDYLKKYIGESYKIEDTQDLIYIGKDFPDEFGGSKDTARLQGTLAKAKANAAQSVPELIKIATNKRYRRNMAKKHNNNAKFGWYRYDARVALPVFDANGKAERYNMFCLELLIRHDANNKMYLYDMVNIKKRNEHPV